MATNRLRTKVRLVKCPKCSKILPEPEQVPLYTCGGCGTILRAKYYSGENNRTTLDSHQSNGVVQTRNDGESSGSNQRSSFGSEQLSDQNEGKEQNATSSARFTSPSSESVFPESNGNIETDSKSELSNLTDCLSNQKEDKLRAENSTNEASLTEGATVLENKQDCDGIAPENHHNQKRIARANSSSGSSRMNESQALESKERLQFDKDYALLVNTEASDDQNHVRDVNSVREGSSSNESLVTANKETIRNESGHRVLGENRKEPPESKLSNENISAEEISHRDKKRIPNLAMEDSHGKKTRDDSVDHIGEQLGSIKLNEVSLSTKMTQEERNDISTAGTEANSQAFRDGGKMGTSNVSRDPDQCESNSTKNVTETLRRQIEDFNDGSAYGSEMLRPTSNPKASESVKVVPRSLTKGSLAYDASISSFDGNDDRVIEQQEHPRSLGFRNQARSSSQIEEESVEENKIPLRNRMRRKNRDGFLPRVPLYRSSELVYETGSSSSCLHNELPIHRMHNYRHPSRYEDSEPWVRRPYAQRRSMEYQRRVPEVMWRENEYLPTYYHNHGTSSEVYHRRRAESLSLSGNLPRVNYSGEMFKGGRYEMRDPCMHRGPNDHIRWSAQFHGPPPAQQAFSWDPYDSSYPSSPQGFTEPSEPYPWAPDDVVSMADDHRRRRDEIVRRSYLREKRQAVKRHFRPLAGGAPFVTCYFCFRVVQLPKDFLLRKRRAIIHRSKCGVCSNILEYSLENGSCLAPCMPNPDDGASEGGEINAGRNDLANFGSRNTLNDGERTKGSHRVGSRSMKVTWNVPGLRSKSPLHRLMGYSSPHDMFNGQEDEGVDW